LHFSFASFPFSYHSIDLSIKTPRSSDDTCKGGLTAGDGSKISDMQNRSRSPNPFKFI